MEKYNLSQQFFVPYGSILPANAYLINEKNFYKILYENCIVLQDCVSALGYRYFSKRNILVLLYPSDERIQILQESCKMIQNFQDSCKNLARYQSRQKNKSGYKCFRKHL